MSLKQRYHQNLTEKIDQLEQQSAEIQRETKQSVSTIDRLRKSIDDEYAKIREQDEAYHTAQQKLLDARKELLDLSDKELPPEAGPNIHPEEQ